MTIQLDYLPNVAAIFMLMFARLGTMVMLLPALGDDPADSFFHQLGKIETGSFGSARLVLDHPCLLLQLGGHLVGIICDRRSRHDFGSLPGLGLPLKRAGYRWFSAASSAWNR